MRINDLKEILGKGKENGIVLSEVVRRTGLNPREVRYLISELQRSGVPVVNFQDGSGYYIADNVMELQRYIKQERARGIASLVRASYLNRYLLENGYEMSGQKIDSLI